MKGQKLNKKHTVFISYFVILLCVLGLQIYLLDYSSLSVNEKLIVYAITAVGVFVCAFCSSLSIMWKKYNPLLPLGLAVLFGSLGNIGLIQSFLKLFNVWLLRWNEFQEDGKNLVSAGDVSTGQERAFVLTVGFLLFSFLCFVKTKTKFIFMNILLLVLLILNLMNGYVVWLALSMTLLGVVGIWFFNYNSGMVRLKTAWMGILMVVFICVPYVLPEQNLMFTKKIRESTSQKVEDLRYGKNPMPEGNLYEADMMETGKEKVMQVHTEQVKTLYLRGFTGSLYENGKWSELPNSAYGYSHSGMLAWLKNNQFEPAMQYASYENASKEKQNANRVQIEVSGTDREYLYTPYSAAKITAGAYQEEKDNGYLSSDVLGAKNYKIVERSDELPGELLVAKDWIKNPKTKKQKQYMETEKVYRKFVYETYITVNEEIEPYIKKYFSDKAKAENTTGVYTITSFIRSQLKKYASYKRNPKQVPEEAEPVLWFLSEGGEGNSALFASAAVAIFREFGIPARYVEGYLLSKEKIQKAKGKAVTLTGEDSHAWVEVYMDGMGWIDVDVTPGFYFEEYDLMQMVQKPQGIQMTAELEERSKDNRGDLNGAGAGKKKPQDRKSLYLRYTSATLVLLFILFVAAVVFLELKRYIRYKRWRKKLRKASQKERCDLIYEMVFSQIRLLGIEAGMGWQTVEVEEKIRRLVPTVYEGEYVMMNALMEKGIYGEKELQDWEVRALFHFANKLIFDVRAKKAGIHYLRKRYS